MTTYIQPTFAPAPLPEPVTIQKGRCYVATCARTGRSGHGSTQEKALAQMEAQIRLEREIRAGGKR